LEDRYGIMLCLEGLAWAANAEGQPVLAARLFGAAAALRERLGAAPWPAWLAEHEQNATATRACLGEERFEVAWAAGRALALDAAIAEALGEGAATVAPAVLPVQVAEAAQVGPLSLREHQVADLIARGMTNRRIAGQLVISEWTVDTHVRHILTKLELRSRAQVAAWVAARQAIAPGSP
jgi:DNA-binding CsgD family transcriptional regulator